MSWASRALFRRPNAWLILCLSPFVWFYMNEARPYIAVMAFAAVAMVAELAYLMYPAKLSGVCSLVLPDGFASLLGQPHPRSTPDPVSDYPVCDQHLEPTGESEDLSAGLVSSAPPSFLPAFLALGAFFFWTSRFGVNMKRADPGIANLAFVFYEFCGFAGLGPSRDELRENPHVHALVGYWPWLLIGVAAAIAVGWSVLRTTPDKRSRTLAISLLAGLSIAFMVAKIAHFQLLGRHVAVFFPLLFILLLSLSPIPALRRRGVIWAPWR